MLQRAATIMLGSGGFELAVAGTVARNAPPRILLAERQELRLDAVVQRNEHVPHAARARASDALGRLLARAEDVAAPAAQVVATGWVWREDPAALRWLLAEHQLTAETPGPQRQARWLLRGVGTAAAQLGGQPSPRLVVDVGREQVRVAYDSGQGQVAVARLPVGTQQLSTVDGSWSYRLDRIRQLAVLTLAPLRQQHPEVRGAALLSCGQSVTSVHYIRDHVRPWATGELLPRRVDLEDLRTAQEQLLSSPPARREEVTSHCGAATSATALLLATVEAARTTTSDVVVSPWGLLEGAALCQLAGGDPQ